MSSQHHAGIQRSSIEAYIGVAIGIISVVFSPTLEVKALLLFILAVFTAFLVTEMRPLARRGNITKRVAAFVCFALICWLGWSPLKAQYDEEQFPPTHLYITQWGPVHGGDVQIERADPPRVKHGVAASEITVDGTLLFRHHDDYNLIGVCFHHARSGDVQDEPNVSKSGVYDIENWPMKILIPWNSQFLLDTLNGARITGYELLAVPKGVRPEQFKTIREAVALGAKRVQAASGTL
jgi:hypothetical protein